MRSQRSFLCLTIVASVHGRFRGGGDFVQPFEPTTVTASIVRTVGCPWENDPVTCRFPPTTTMSASSSSDEDDEESDKSRPRTYSSICFASRAGYKIEHCYSRDRSTTANDASSNTNAVLLTCMSVTDVVCQEGDDEPHKFANLCLAQVGGYRGADCATSLSTDQRRGLHRHPRNLQNNDYVYCPEWYRPVYCTLSAIMFSSDCEAGVAGYSLHDCTLPDGVPAGTCPSDTGRGSVGPLSCNGTQYDSICLASAANYAPSVDCVLLDNSTVQTTSIVRKCATSGKVLCGRRQRAFDNMCRARKAGFTRRRCQSI